jgi:hypothetical protein
MERTFQSVRGKMELTKCFYYILAWKFDPKGNPIPTTIAEQCLVASQINIPAIDRNTEVIIQQKEINKAHKTLGCYENASYETKMRRFYI